MTGKIQRLNDQEDYGHSQHAKEFEVDPGVTVKIIHHVQISPAHDQKEGDPAYVESPPDMVFQVDLGAHQPLNQGFFPEKMAAQKGDAENPVDYGGLPFDELFIAQVKSQAAENYQDHQGDQLHGRHLAGFQPGDGDMKKGCGDGYSSRNIDVVHLIGDEKKQDGQEIGKEFHGYATSPR